MLCAMQDRSEIARKAAETRWAQTPRTPRLVKTLRIEPEVWLQVIDRAAFKKLTPNEWVIRAIKAGLKEAGKP